MHKRTRMIILTKANIIKNITLFSIISICIILLFAVSKKETIMVFSNYEKILDREILNNQESYDYGTKLLKHIYKFDIVSTPSPEPSPKAEPTEPPMLIESEELKIDKGLEINNGTNYQINIDEYINKPLDLKGNANILIVHTHTTESFSKVQYTRDSPDRNLDENYNMIAVGKAMNEVFQKNEINSFHDTTVHDYPSYNKSYQKACATIEKNLKNNPSINIVLDIHRDGITRDDGTKVKLVTDIGGVDTAQIMLVVGTNTNLQHDNWQENLAFAAQIQAKAVAMYPGLMRPIDLRKERFNQQLTDGSIIIEVGANGNTLEEAINGGKAIAEVISELIR